MEINYAEIGKKIRIFRKEKGYTQESLSEKSGIEPSYLSHIERGATKLSLPTLVSIANALEVSLDDLVYSDLVKNSTPVNSAIADIMKDLSPKESAAVADFLKNSIMSFRKFSEK